MTEESLSALFDGECRGEELDLLLAQLHDCPELRRKFSRLQFMRDASRGVHLAQVPLDFADRVMAAIGEAVQVLPGLEHPNVVPFAARWRGILKPALGLAAAAGVAGMAVLTLLPADEAIQPQNVAVAPPDVSVAPPAAVVMTAAQPSADPALRPAVRRDEAARRRAAGLHWAQIEPDQAQQLNGYLIDYSTNRSAHGVGGTLGYARFAAHSADYRAPEEQR